MTEVVKTTYVNGAFPNNDDALYTATRAWLLWLQGLFSTRPSGEYKWSQNQQETEIVIADQYPDKEERTNTRPKIITSRGPASFMSSSVNQAMDISPSSNRTRYADLVGTTIVLSILAKEGLEAQRLAYTVFRLIPVFKASIARLGNIHFIGNNITIGPESGFGQIVPGSSSPEWTQVQVMIPIFIQEIVDSTEEDFYTLVRRVNLLMGLSET
jgi:hypothetical protein